MKRGGRLIRRVTRATPRQPALVTRFPPPEVPWTPEYAATHNAFLETMLDDEDLTAGFANKKELPDGYGVGLDERVVEYPWLISHLSGGRVLDAGSVLNHAHILDRVLPVVESLTITTLQPEPLSFPERGINYHYGDLRELPFDDESFDAVVCLSTLEHVGMDNSVYGAEDARDDDPRQEARRAFTELERVLAPGGKLMLSVPFGKREDHGWFRQFDAEDLADLLSVSRFSAGETEIFAYAAGGWQRCTARDAALCEYRDYHHDKTPAADLAAAARAVACVVVERPHSSRSHEEIAQDALSGAVEIATDVGPMLAHGHDKVITPIIRATGAWEPHLRDVISAEMRPGMSVADVGANIGYFARVMSAAVGPTGHVTAVEPDPGNVALLRRNAQNPPGAPISVVHAAAWDEPGSLDLARCKDNTGDHRIAAGGSEREVVTVEAVVLDELLTDGVDLLMLDTQGVEHIVLRGATRLLHGPRRPIVFAEFWPAGLEEAGIDPLDVLREYRSWGFKICVVEAPGSDLHDGAPVESILEAILAIEPERYGTLRLQLAPQSLWSRLRGRRTA